MTIVIATDHGDQVDVLPTMIEALAEDRVEAGDEEHAGRRPSSRSAAATTPGSDRPSRRGARCAAGTDRSCRCRR